jgi:hypothetical protein
MERLTSSEGISVRTNEGAPALATVTLVIPGLVVALNRTYRPGVRNNAPTIRRTYEGQEYHDRIVSVAKLAALNSPTWPKDPWQPTHVKLSTYAFNTRTDAGAANKIVADALEGIFYVNDEIVSWGESPRPQFDDNGPRLIVYLELLAFEDAKRTEMRRAYVLANQEKRRRAKRTKRPAG